MLRAVFFDIDNTLYDSTTLARMARLNSIRAMIDAGLEGEEEELYARLQRVIARFGSNYPKHYDELLKDLRVPWSPKIVAAGVVAYERTKFGYLVPFPGVIPTLLELKAKYRLGVISNGIAVKQWEKLINLGVHHFFECVITSEEVGCEKPEAEIFHTAMQALGVEPEESVMVGDCPRTDAEGARRVGMKTVLVRLRGGEEGQAQEADAVVHDFRELPETLRRIESVV
ncbi:MAG: TIGR02253 family HAD-type hydrolase [Euryarchaeota archaeon]|nr:TIGR02253 family HAD-type hydrolase [Euryarchaeota archaeon]